MVTIIKTISPYTLLIALSAYLLTNDCLANNKKYSDTLDTTDTTQQESATMLKSTNQGIWFTGPQFKKQRKDGFIVLPLVYYSPDTRWAAGGMFAYHFKFVTPGKANEQSRLSYIQLTTDYTQNKQLDVWGQWRIFMNDNGYIWIGEARYRNYPDRFYGVGNKTIEANEERYSYDLLRFRSRVSKRLVKNVYLGVDYQLSRYYNLSMEPGKQLASSEFKGTQGGINSGVGLVFMIDTRDNVVSASKGVFLETSGFVSNAAIGSNFNYSNYNLTFNKYFSLGNRMVLATNTVMNFNTGNTPFIDLAQAGGNSILRGYAQYRFRDYNFVASQIEYRYMIWRKFGFVAFAGLGDVFNRTDDLEAQYLKYSLGGGVRVALDTQEKINLRVDYGLGRGNTGVYVSVTEAF